jgi:hypothetical protein
MERRLALHRLAVLCGWREVARLVQDVVVSAVGVRGEMEAAKNNLRSVKKTDHGRVWQRHTRVVRRLGEGRHIDLVALGTVQIHDLEADAGGGDDGFRERDNGHVVDLAVGSFDVQGAVRLDVAHGDEVFEVVRVLLHPRAREQLAGSALRLQHNGGELTLK